MTAPSRAESKPLTEPPVRYPSPGPRPGGSYALSPSLPRASDGPGGAHLREQHARRAGHRPGPGPARGDRVEERLGARAPSSTRSSCGASRTPTGTGRETSSGLISRLDFLNDGKPETTTDLGRRRPLAHAGLRVPELSRLRHHRLREDRPGLWHERRLREAPRRGAPARHPGHRRPRRQPQRRRPPVVRLRGLLAGVAVPRLLRLERDGPGLEAALGRQHRHLAPERRRVLLRRLLERDARPELALAGAARGDEADRLPLARARRRRLPPRRDALPRRDGRGAASGRHVRDARRAEGVRRPRPPGEARRRFSSARTGPTRTSSRPTTARRPSRAATSSRRASTSRSRTGSCAPSRRATASSSRASSTRSRRPTRRGPSTRRS